MPTLSAKLQAEFNSVETELNNLSTTSAGSDRMIELSQRYNKLLEIKETATQVDVILKQISDLESISDPEMVEIVATERESLGTKLAELQSRYEMLTQTPLLNDDKPAIIEIRPGTGGTEASLFAQELMGMYLKYAQSVGWAHEIDDVTYDMEGGIKSAIISINTKGCYAKLRFESGVHRVQRVPATEAAGRIHTSTASVVILPQVEASQISIADKDIRIDVYRSSGPGGQSVNTTDSAVRITHLPTKIIVTCQESKSQLKNKEKALKILAAKLQANKQAEDQARESQERKEQMKDGDRSAKIRTYNFPQSRVTDHRVKITWYNIHEIISGELEEVINSTQAILRKEINER